MTSCSDCFGAAAGCAWCEAEKLCVEKAGTPFCNRTSVCCSSFATCSDCNAKGAGECGWCGTSNECVATSALQSCPVVADEGCCNLETSCAGCSSNGACAWCDAPAPGAPFCALKSAGCPAPAVADPACCSDKPSCDACNADPGSGCGWCTASPQRCTTRSLDCGGGVFADGSCCEARPDCVSCQQVPGCQFCLQDNTCHSNETQLCPNPADRQCCNVQQGQSCAGCVGSPGCGFCTASRRCTDAPCATLNVEESTAWQCDNPVLLNCESFDKCSSCVGTSGCVWIGTVWINGVPQSNGLCFTGGLFGLSNSQVPGFVITTPAGYYWETCSMTATSLLILIGSLAAGVLAAALLVTLACLCARRRRLRAAGGDVAAAAGFGFGESPAVNVEAQPLTEAPKKKKKRVAKPVPYEMPVDSVRATNTRYYQNRKK